jgi:hypothetical protein
MKKESKIQKKLNIRDIVLDLNSEEEMKTLHNKDNSSGSQTPTWNKKTRVKENTKQ